MEFENLLKLIDKFSESELDSLSFEEDETRIKLGKHKKKITEADNALFADYVKQSVVQGTSEGSAPVAKEDFETNEGYIIKSPLVGVFYSAPSETSDPFVALGDNVKQGQTLAIIEAMKLMNEIESETEGVVKEIYVKNGETVEYGQPLFMIG